MSQKKQLTIIEFSRLTGIKRENLRFYDRIGLLSPAMRGENNYRYYSRHQLSSAYLISDLRGLGVGIADIKQYVSKRSPEETLAMFAQQEIRVKAEIKRLQEAKLILQMHAKSVRDALGHINNEVVLVEKESEQIFLCPPIPANMNEDEASIFSYDYAEENQINLGFPLGTLIKQSQLTSENKIPGSQNYFKVGKNGNAYKKPGLYAVAYGYYDLWEAEPLYQKLLSFINEQGLRVCGDAYEEYPLSSSVEQDKEQYCLCIEIPVEK